MGSHDDAKAAAAPKRVPDAAGEHAHLEPERWSAAFAHVVAACRPTEGIASPRQRRKPRVVSGSPVRHAGAGHIAHTAAPGLITALPVFLVAPPAQMLVELAYPLPGASADGHVGSPHEIGIAVVWPEVERCDRSRLAPAA